MAMSAEESHRVVTALVEAANEQAARAEALEREVRAVSDALASLVRHQQAEMLEVRGHLAASHVDMGKTMAAIESALQVTVDSAGGRFVEFQRDYEGLMTQLNSKIQEHERVITEMANKGAERHKELSQEIQKVQMSLQSPPAAGTQYYDVSSPQRHQDFQSKLPPAASAHTAASCPHSRADEVRSDQWSAADGGACGGAWAGAAGAAGPADGGARGGAWGPGGGPTGGYYRWQPDGQQSEVRAPPQGASDPWMRGYQGAPQWFAAAGQWSPPAGTGQWSPAAAGVQWPPRIGSSAYLSPSSSIFEIKFAQSNENKFDGEKDGENWQRKIRNYFCGRLPVMKPLLEWAEAFGKTEITQKDVEGLRCLLDEDPVVINNLL